MFYLEANNKFYCFRGSLYNCINYGNSAGKQAAEP